MWGIGRFLRRPAAMVAVAVLLAFSVATGLGVASAHFGKSRSTEAEEADRFRNECRDLIAALDLNNDKFGKLLNSVRALSRTSDTTSQAQVERNVKRIATNANALSHGLTAAAEVPQNQNGIDKASYLAAVDDAGVGAKSVREQFLGVVSSSDHTEREAARLLKSVRSQSGTVSAAPLSGALTDLSNRRLALTRRCQFSVDDSTRE